MFFSKGQYQIWLTGRYNSLTETSSFRKDVENQFDKTVLQLFKTDDHNQIRARFLDAGRSHYLNLAGQKAKRDESLNRIGTIGSAVLFTGVFIYFGFKVNDPISEVFIFIFVLWIILVSVFIYRQKKRRKRLASEQGNELIKAALETGFYKKIESGQFPELALTLTEIGKTMGLSLDYENYYYDPRLNCSPAISVIQEKDKSKIVLTLTRSSILMHKENKAKFKAIYCHELSHVLQQDTKLWHSQFLPVEIFLPLLRGNELDIEFDSELLDTTTMDLDYSDFDVDIEDAIGAAGLPGLSLLMRPYLKKKQINAKKNIQKGLRYESEFLADFGAVVFSSDLTIMDLLQKEFFLAEMGEEHPSTELRLISLKYHLCNVFQSLKPVH